ncbi:MAG: SPOR domain-containing protein [Vicinamibacterales bacterium]
MSEEGFHEIQLSGKQLVFLFMATTVVSVVIFLTGVLVGRGVGAETVIADATGTTLEAAADVAQASPDPGLPPAEPPPTVPEEPDQFSYHTRLQQSAPQQEQVNPAPPAQPAPPAAAPATADMPQPASDGWVAQIGAYNSRAAADSVVATLKRSNFPAFVLAPTPGSPTTSFRVRVGPYRERRDAEAVAGRLQREHQFTPFVTR